VTTTTVMVSARPVPKAVVSFQKLVRCWANHWFTPRSAACTDPRSMMFVSSSPINDITPQIEMAPASGHSATVQRSSDPFQGGAICPDLRAVVLS